MSKPHIHLTAVASAGSFTDCILFCQKGLEGLGYTTSTAPGVTWDNHLNIIFCSQMMTWTEINNNAKQVILYNWEPAAPDIGRFPPTYIRQMQHTHVWDYNEQNVQLLKNAGIQDIHYVPMGYAPGMQRVPIIGEPDIDVLFYGEINQRRRQVIDEIRAKGLYVVTSDDVGYMSAEVRDGYIARAKVVLNMHFFEQAKVFEVARVAYLLANKKAVVAELSSDTHIESDILNAIEGGDLDVLPQLCWDLVHDDARRYELEQRAFDVFSKRDAVAIMQTAIGRYYQQSAATPPLLGNTKKVEVPLPSILQLSAGFLWRYDYCNIDVRANMSSDLYLDIGKNMPSDIPIQSWRFGEVILREGMFKKILAHDFFSRVKDFRQALSNCLYLLEEGGELHITIPLDMSHESWSKSDCRRVFNDYSWGKILANWWQYGWETHRFEVSTVATGVVKHNSYAFGVMNAIGGDWSKAAFIPRALDVQQLILCKRALTDEERKQLPQIRFMGK